MNTIALDIETDDLDATRIWCIVARDVNGGDYHVFKHPDKLDEERQRYLDLVESVDKVVMHNGVGFDWRVLCRFFGEGHLPFDKVVDTLIISRLLRYDRKGGHSLGAWGKRVFLDKGTFTDFSGGLTEEMIDYCKNDVDVTVKVYKKLAREIKENGGMETWAKPIRTEHTIQKILEKATENGFLFKAEDAEAMLNEINARMAHLEEEFQRDFPPKLEIVNTLQYKLKADGLPHVRVAQAQEKYPKTEVVEDTLVCYDYIPFAPGSPKKRIDRLWEAGWKPVAKTDGHLDWERDMKDAQRKGKVPAILSGSKENETDIHNLNRRALGLDHITRDNAKTFIYAFLLGAGNAKVAEILSCSTQQAAEAVENFTQSIEGLARLKKTIIPRVAKRGWFKGLDGRRVGFPGQHYILAGMLQNGESTLMKYACLKWMQDADNEGIDYRLLTWPHDEWQTEVTGSRDMADRLGKIQRDAIVWAGETLELFCPQEGSTDIGENWRECH